MTVSAHKLAATPRSVSAQCPPNDSKTHHSEQELEKHARVERDHFLALGCRTSLGGHLLFGGPFRVVVPREVVQPMIAVPCPTNAPESATHATCHTRYAAREAGGSTHDPYSLRKYTFASLLARAWMTALFSSSGAAERTLTMTSAPANALSSAWLDPVGSPSGSV